MVQHLDHSYFFEQLSSVWVVHSLIASECRLEWAELTSLLCVSNPGTFSLPRRSWYLLGIHRTIPGRAPPVWWSQRLASVSPEEASKSQSCLLPLGQSHLFHLLLMACSSSSDLRLWKEFLGSTHMASLPLL